MSKTVIKIENLSKIYRLGEVGTGTLSHDLNRWFRMNLLGQDDHNKKVKKTKINHENNVRRSQLLEFHKLLNAF